jgi:excinuclease ABC subunit C
VPQRGDKVTLLETVTRNAKEDLMRHRLRRASDHNSRSRALTEIQDALNLPEAPLRIECYDMAHFQGTDYVGSMVVLEDGLPARSEYRRFKIKTVDGNNDFAAMEEVLRRRLSKYVAERDGLSDESSEDVVPENESKRARAKKFAYPPQLLLVDGGKGQLSVAVRVIQELGLENEIPVAALAKKFEEVFLPGNPAPIILPRGSEALFMLQRIRDEAHRFANKFHADLRNKRMKESVLDEIQGLGPGRRERLLKEFGSLTAVKKASMEELKAISWLPDVVAENIHRAFNPVDERLESNELE